MSFKIKMISRNPDDYTRETKNDIFKVPRNYKAVVDPFRGQVEYTRALNAAKLERVFAKPFIASLDGHTEGVHLLYKHSTRLSTVFSGARDGQVKIWHLTSRRCLQTIQTHNGPINGISVDDSNGENFLTVGQDSQLKIWNLSAGELEDMDISEPLHSIALQGVAHAVSHVSRSSDFVTCGDGVNVWKLYRDNPIRSYELGPNTVHAVRCNPIEDSVIACCTSDRSIFLLDSRQRVPLTRVVLKLRSNRVSWHPLESRTFTVANEDYNLYTFDMRSMEAARNVHHGHTMAVMDVDYSPTGAEFVSAGYDQSLRIFPVDSSISRDVYHAPRMQNVQSVLWSLDNKFVLSGSDDMNIRVWKSKAAEKLGPLRPREKASLNYAQQLRDTYQHHPEIRRILKHRQVPKHIFSATNEHKIIQYSQKRKQDNLRRNTKRGVPYVSERVTPIIREGLEE